MPILNCKLSAWASSASTTLTVTTDTSYTQGVSGSATETITLGTNNRGSATATTSGASTTGGVLSITAHNQSLSGGSVAASYTVLSTDTLLTIANGLAADINAVASLQTLGVSAATNLATQISSQSFTGTSALPAGASAASVTSVDGSNNTKTNNYLVSVTGTPSTALTYDADGNMTSDGINDYSWDAENRLIKITYPSTATSQFTYDAFGHTVKIVESTGSTKQFVWSGGKMCEARDGTGALLNQYFLCGQTISGSKYFYTRDHLGSVREMTDSSGNIQAQYSYDSYGRVTLLQGSLASDFQYAGYYFHTTSGLSLAVHRAYSSGLSRWLSRDPFAERAGTNLYTYVVNDPAAFADPDGTFVGLGFIIIWWILDEGGILITVGTITGVGIGVGLSPRGSTGNGDQGKKEACKKEEPCDPDPAKHPEITSRENCLQWCRGSNCKPEDVSQCISKCLKKYFPEGPPNPMGPARPPGGGPPNFEPPKDGSGRILAQ